MNPSDLWRVIKFSTTDLSASVLGQQDLITDGNGHRNDGTVLVTSSGSHSDNGGGLDLLLRLLGDHDSSLGLCDGLSALHQDAVQHGDQAFHGSGLEERDSD